MFELMASDRRPAGSIPVETDLRFGNPAEGLECGGAELAASFQPT